MKNTNAINFLLYSYFGFTVEDCKGKWDEGWKNVDEDHGILRKIIDKAYKDATQQGAYNILIDQKDRESSKNSKKEGVEIIKSGILELFDSKEDYDEKHNDICIKLIGEYEGIKDKKGNNAFTYGNAQKWLNMTMKYLYVVNQVCEEYYDEEEYSNETCKDSFFVKIQKIKNVEKKLHVPVDSYIIQAAWEEKTVKLPLKDDRKDCREKNYKNPADYVEAWSKWDNKPKENALGDYSDFQASLKKCIDNRIDWECRKWIEIAKKRRGEGSTEEE